MSDIPHRRLTRPKKVFEFFFDGALKSTAQEGVIKLEPIADGQLNAVCFWFDLHLDEEATITTAPSGIGKGGQVVADEDAVRFVPRRGSSARLLTRHIGCVSCADLVCQGGRRARARRLPRRRAGTQPRERVQQGCRKGALLGPGVAVPGAQSGGACMPSVVLHAQL